MSPTNRQRIGRDWTGIAASVDLGLGLGVVAALCGVALWLREVLAADTFQLYFAALGAYLFALAMLLALPGLRRQPQRQALAVGALMLAFAVACALWIDLPAAGWLLAFPVTHALLRLGRRATVAAVAVAAAGWVTVRTPVTGAAPADWVIVAAELLAAGAVLGILRYLRGELISSRSRITALSYQDELTGLLNMRAFARMLQAEHRKSAAGNRSYALLMIDIENLQHFNDTYGHEQGNRVIASVADAVRRSMRTDDLVARYGGDEFVVYLPGASDTEAEMVSNRIGQNVYNITLSFDRRMQRVCVNTGTAIYPDSGADIQQLLSFARQAMQKNRDFRRSTQPAKPDPEALRAQAGVSDWA